MSDSELRELYDIEIRAQPRVRPGFSVECIDGVIVLCGVFNFVCHCAFGDKHPEQVVGPLVRRFQGARQGLIWDVHSHDDPATLSESLQAMGLREVQISTLMLRDTALIAADQPHKIDVRRVTDFSGLRDFVRVGAEAFGHQDAWMFDAFCDRLDSDEDVLFVAYVRGKPAGSSRIELSHHARFASLYGGGVALRYRGRGIYRAMVAARAAEAKARGVQYLITSARETSRPILEHFGFRRLTQVRRWELSAS